MSEQAVVIGGGISGLSAAWALHRQGYACQILESRDRVGGNLRTGHSHGYLYEHGPNSTLQKANSPVDALGRLVSQLGLDDQLVEANPAAAKRFILKNGQLVALPTSPPAFITSPLFSLAAKVRLLAEPFIARGETEESIAQFVRRRLGQEFLDYAIEPFISGVYAGNPATLSIQAAVPKIYALEKEHGSLIRGALAMGKAMKGAGMPKGRLVSFRAGMDTLPKAIAQQLPSGAVHTKVKVTALLPLSGGEWKVVWQAQGGQEHTTTCQKLVLSLPAPAAAPLLEPLSPNAARLVGGIAYAPIASVALGFVQNKVKHPLDGFGFLIPRREGVTTLGALFSSTLFAGRAPAGHVLITAFIGGAIHPEVMEKTDAGLVEQVVKDLTPCLGIQGEPVFVSLTRYQQAIPQYTMGHLTRLTQVKEELAPFANLILRANWKDGISVSDCTLHGEQVIHG
ncbi:MAG: protoporphyrinogen oxidase [Magnetococcales bacterium]|nr:protoporphyrinogen oxidase [Magnetococcales bacterium]NGZ26556.1 protoporphyrinogen oxidase [Magnetococcales bacterium]